MAKATQKSQALPDVELTLTGEEAQSLQKLLVDERWPSSEENVDRVNAVYRALDEAGVSPAD